MRDRRRGQGLQGLARGTLAADDGLAAPVIAIGYSDETHCNRECRAFAGVTPAAHRRTAPREPNHLPVDPGRAVAWPAA